MLNPFILLVSSIYGQFIVIPRRSLSSFLYSLNLLMCYLFWFSFSLLPYLVGNVIDNFLRFLPADQPNLNSSQVPDSFSCIPWICSCVTWDQVSFSLLPYLVGNVINNFSRFYPADRPYLNPSQVLESSLLYSLNLLMCYLFWFSFSRLPYLLGPMNITLVKRMFGRR